MSKKLTKVTQRSILNIQYAVFLGVIGSFCFSLENQPVDIKPVIDPFCRPESILMIIYYLLDWLSYNVMPIYSLRPIAHVFLFLRVGWVSVLGVTVIASNSSGIFKYDLFLTYFIITGIYDMVREINSDKIKPLELIVAGVRLGFGLFFLFPVFVYYYFGRTDVYPLLGNPNTWNDFLFYIILIYVGIKFIRYFIIAR